MSDESIVDNDEYIVINSPKFGSNFEILFTFLQGTKGIVRGPYRWSMSIFDKYRKMQICYEDVLNQVPIWKEEQIKLKEQGFISSLEGQRLAVRYENYLNSIYSFCEALSQIVAGFYPKENLPKKFHSQKKRFLDKDIDQKYATILRETNWYDEVRSIRSEHVHFLSGIPTISQSGEPGYFNVPLSQRGGKKDEISIDNIVQHAEDTYNGLNQFLILFGDHFISKIDPQSRVFRICVVKKSTHQIFGRTISLHEYLNGENGLCQSLDLDCPKRDSCDAYLKAKDLH